MFVFMITIYIDRKCRWYRMVIPKDASFPGKTQDLKDAAAAAGTKKESLPSFPWKKKKKKGPVMMR